MLDQHWRPLGSRRVADHRVISVRYDGYRLEPEGRCQDFVVLEAPDWVVIVPETAGGDYVMVRQFRFGTRRSSLEFPGGVIDQDEEPVAAAVRELREETGYTAAEAKWLGSFSPNSALMANRCHVVLATGVEPTGAPQLDEFECVSVELHRQDSLPRLIAEGQVDHALMLAVITFASAQKKIMAGRSVELP